jgi:glycosyltransferase involved in cell wall biosynthesis
MCYLAVELARLGHAVTTLTGTASEAEVLGVRCLPESVAGEAFFAAQSFDVVVILNGPATRSDLRLRLPAHTQLVLWTGHNVDQAAMQALAKPTVRDLWDRIVCVSSWHRTMVLEAFDADPAKVVVLRNAIAPAFENLFSSREALISAKSNSLHLAYTSTPFRGLELMLDIFPAFRAKNPEATFDIYSSMAVYGQRGANDKYGALYEKFRAIAGVRYFGSLPQPELAAALVRSHVLSYPNTFAETSCISVMEAMAAGLKVVTSDFGALRETTAGYGDLVALKPSSTRDKFVAQYKRALAGCVGSVREPGRMYKQVLDINQTGTWRVRASEWTRFVRALASAGARG